MSDTMTEPEVNSYPPQGTPMDPADHPATSMPEKKYTGMKIGLIGNAIKDEVQAFQRTFTNAKKVTGQD